MITRTLPSDVSLDGLIQAARDAERAGTWDEALLRYEQAFDRAVRDGQARAAVEVLRWIGTVHRERGHLEEAEELYELSLGIAEAHGLSDQVAPALNCLAAIDQFRGRPQQAEELYLRAKQVAEAAGDRRLVAIVDQNLGALANIRGDVGGAIDSYRSALESARSASDDRAAIAALNNMGMAHVDLDELTQAERCFDEAYELARRASDSLSLGYVQLNRAETHLKRQQYEQARQCCDDGSSIFARLESRTGLGEAYKFYGVIYRDTGKSHLAEVHLELAMTLAQGASNRLLQAEVQHELARVHAEATRHREAIRCLNAAHELFREMQARRDIQDIEEQLTELEQSYLGIVEQWGSSAIESKDPYTLGHSRRVAELGALLAEKVGFTGHDLVWLKIGGFLHDVGKTVVPPAVLTKPGPLSEDEWALMRRHTTVGDQIVSSLNLPYHITPVIRSHHERWDGRGYPDGLSGEEIPRVARILAVVDQYDAMTSKRAYRDALSPEKTMEILERESGAGLDPELFDVFRSEIWPALVS